MSYANDCPVPWSSHRSLTTVHSADPTSTLEITVKYQRGNVCPGVLKEEVEEENEKEREVEKNGKCNLCGESAL